MISAPFAHTKEGLRPQKALSLEYDRSNIHQEKDNDRDGQKHIRIRHIFDFVSNTFLCCRSLISHIMLPPLHGIFCQDLPVFHGQPVHSGQPVR